MNQRIEDTRCDAPECKSAAAYQDVRGNWCGWHWSLLPPITASNGMSNGFVSQARETFSGEKEWTP